MAILWFGILVAMRSVVFREVGVDFDPSAVDACLPFVQSTPYFLWNTSYGRVGRRFAGFLGSKPVFFSQFFVYTPRFVRVLYAPLGPLTVGSSFDVGAMEQFVSFLRGAVSDERYTFVRMHLGGDVSGLRRCFRFAEAGSFFQARYDRVIAFDELYEFPANVLREVRKAEKGLSLEVVSLSGAASEDALSDLLRLLSETSQRTGMRMHDEAYYRALAALPQGFSECFELLFAVFQGVRVGVCVIARGGANATYLFGGTGDVGRKMSALYFLQYHALQRVREQGMKQYSFGGTLKSLDNKQHPLYGVSFFKKRFGGSVKDYGRGYDLVLDAPRYALYSGYKFVRR